LTLAPTSSIYVCAGRVAAGGGIFSDFPKTFENRRSDADHRDTQRG
jgi:hypothetical protein